MPSTHRLFTKSTCIRIPPAIHKKYKILAAQKNCTLQSLIIDCLTQGLKRLSKKDDKIVE